MNIFAMLSSSRGSKKLTIGNVIKFSNYKSSVLHTELRVSTLVLFILIVKACQLPIDVKFICVLLHRRDISCEYKRISTI